MFPVPAAHGTSLTGNQRLPRCFPHIPELNFGNMYIRRNYDDNKNRKVGGERQSITLGQRFLAVTKTIMDLNAWSFLLQRLRHFLSWRESSPREDAAVIVVGRGSPDSGRLPVG